VVYGDRALYVTVVPKQACNMALELFLSEMALMPDFQRSVSVTVTVAVAVAVWVKTVSVQAVYAVAAGACARQ